MHNLLLSVKHEKWESCEELTGKKSSLKYTQDQSESDKIRPLLDESKGNHG